LKQKREFLPLVPDTDGSVLIRPDGSSKAHSPNERQCPSHQTAGNYVQLQYTEVLTYTVIAKIHLSFGKHNFS